MIVLVQVIVLVKIEYYEEHNLLYFCVSGLCDSGAT